jgi:uncharacterized coiled-coil protein SlyX
MLILVYVLTLLGLINCNGVSRHHWQNHQHDRDAGPSTASDSYNDLLKALEMRHQHRDAVYEMYVNEVESIGRRLREKEERLLVLEEEQQAQKATVSFLQVSLDDTKAALDKSLDTIKQLQGELKMLQDTTKVDRELLENKLNDLDKMIQNAMKSVVAEKSLPQAKSWELISGGFEKTFDTISKCMEKAIQPFVVAHQKLFDSTAQCIGMITMLLAFAYFTYRSFHPAINLKVSDGNNDEMSLKAKIKEDDERPPIVNDNSPPKHPSNGH